MDTIIVRFGCNNVHQPKMTKELNHCYVWLRHKKNRRQMPAAFWMQLITQSELSSLCSLFDGNCGGNGHTDHRVVARADQTHHLNVSRNGGRTGKLSVRMHTAHGIGHTVGSRTCGHVIRMQGTAGAAAGSNREVLLSGFDALLLIGAGYRMLETGRVGGVTGDGNVNVLFPHDGNAFLNIVSTVAVDLGARRLGILGIARYTSLSSPVL